ncbi:MAG: hypothetical protein ACOC32_04345 [Nanoarchaeota archaeon]
MADGNSIMVQELSDKKNLAMIEKTVKKLIKKSGVLSGKVTFLPYGLGSSNCTLFFKIPASDAVYGEELTILIRPDKRTDHRILRVMIQEGIEVIDKEENKDSRRLSADDVFRKEILAIEADIKELLRDYVKKKEMKKAS